MDGNYDEGFEQQENTKRSSRIAGKGNRLNEAPSSEGDLVIDEYEEMPNPGKKKHFFRLKEEPVDLTCTWQDCSEHFDNYTEYIHHAEDHALSVEANDKGEYPCEYRGCKHQAKHLFYLAKHVAFHVYHERLKNIGENVVERRNLPKCTEPPAFEVPTVDYDYECKWGDCKYISGTLHEFIEHIQVHTQSIGNPKRSNKNKFLFCRWKICKSKFSSRWKLSDHVRSHTKQKTIACPTCGTMFATKLKLIDHRKRQIPVELHSYQCSECFKLFASERLLRDHIRAHVNHLKCSMCDMTCRNPSKLARHILMRHLDEKLFKCTLCEQQCVSKYNLDLHLETHCAEKLMACEECDYRCRSVAGLDSHYHLVHGQGTPPVYECHCCKETFSRGCYLSKHLMQTHGFTWPPGHPRFRYKVGIDGIYRLNTLRYESLEVTQEMMKCHPPIDTNIKYKLKKSSNTEKGVPNFVVHLGGRVSEHLNDEDVDEPTEKIEDTEQGLPSSMVQLTVGVQKKRQKEHLSGADVDEPVGDAEQGILSSLGVKEKHLNDEGVEEGGQPVEDTEQGIPSLSAGQEVHLYDEVEHTEQGIPSAGVKGKGQECHLKDEDVDEGVQPNEDSKQGMPSLIAGIRVKGQEVHLKDEDVVEGVQLMEDTEQGIPTSAGVDADEEVGQPMEAEWCDDQDDDYCNGRHGTEIIITINDVDEKGNIIKSQIVKSSEIVDFDMD